MSRLKPLFIPLMLCVFAIPSFGQDDDYMQIMRDRIEARDPALVSDTSKLNKESAALGFRLFDIEPSPCNEDANPYELLQRVSSKSFHGSVLDIELAIVANCCASFIGEIEVVNDTILNLLFTEYGSECFCHCCFQLTYRIEASSNPFTAFQLNGKAVSETDRTLKQLKEEQTFYKNGELKTLTTKLEDEIQYVQHFDSLGNVVRVDRYVNGQLQYSRVDGQLIRPDGTVLRGKEK